ncbi:PVC-type heme-binding CxxCH protein [Frigoriglobus tundricola]|uniref:Beta-propeller-type glycoside hydrolase n=1 Tax=Frigoriglobus tundricola TaxID=2774151 RepID=A0A6M5YZV3_9BACT|nr:PVC-type heme-binding CxxCH protein [Frigoriglobus tundricola]QJW99408.1 beta-propeller-type glycoside hydrolase [Frigoriglobus tundricola]
MRTRIAVLVISSACLASPDRAAAEPKPPEAPTTADKRLVVELFAAAPDIVHPIALDFDAKGRLLVVESHTHFRPAKYDGPKFDRIRVVEDTDGDGKADRFTTFYEGTTHTMDLAVHPDGSVYVATRNEIIRLRDTKGDGRADEKTRIVFLDTKGNYPHNGLCGLSFDSRGDLNFGIGENLGADYKLVGSDGATLTGGGEGGNVYHCTADGKKLRRVATGFWNPFGSCRDIFGRLFVVDNDPDASPPCRLLDVVEGGDYGFQFRYGRAGRHPFQAWNGELPGTLPFVAGTGESPCEVISYESDGLPDEYRGELLVPAWADHRIERYTLKPNGASFRGERKPFIQGGKDFYPSGLTVAPNGSLFASDWGSRSYELHGKGAIWHIKWKDAKPAARPKELKEAIQSTDRKTREGAARELAKTEDGCAHLREQLKSKDVRVKAAALTVLIDVDDPRTNLWLMTLPEKQHPQAEQSRAIRAMAVRGLVALDGDMSQILDQNGEEPAVLAEALAGERYGRGAAISSAIRSADPFLRHAAIQRMAVLPPLLRRMPAIDRLEPQARIAYLLAWRASGLKSAPKVLPDFLKDPDPDVRFLALKWVSDEKLTEFRPQIVELLKSRTHDPRGYIALATTLARLDGKPVNEDSLATYFLDRLNDGDAPPPARLMALRAIPATHRNLHTERLVALLKLADPTFRIEVLRALKDRADAKCAPAVLAIARDAKEPAAVRAQAVLTLSAAGEGTDALVALAASPDAVVRHEALRALNGTKLDQSQETALLLAIKGKDDSSALAARVLGKAVNMGRPGATDTEAWLKRLDGPADPDAGRRVFESPKLAGCYKCHQVEGRGANVGPDLSLIGRTERKWIVESVLQPSAVVAPHYQAWKIELTDGRPLTGLLIGTYLDVSEYIDEAGNRFKVAAGEVADVRAAKNSIMPDGLLDKLTDQEIRDLVAYLAARK